MGGVASTKVSWEALSHPGEFGVLAAKLTAAIVAMVPQTLRRAIDLQGEHMATGDRAMAGRPALRGVSRHFAMESPIGAATVYEDFIALRLRGKDVTSVQRYIGTWDDLVASIDPPLLETQLLLMFKSSLMNIG